MYISEEPAGSIPEDGGCRFLRDLFVATYQTTRCHNLEDCNEKSNDKVAVWHLKFTALVLLRGAERKTHNKVRSEYICISIHRVLS